MKIIVGWLAHIQYIWANQANFIPCSVTYCALSVILETIVRLVQHKKSLLKPTFLSYPIFKPVKQVCVI